MPTRRKLSLAILKPLLALAIGGVSAAVFPSQGLAHAVSLSSAETPDPTGSTPQARTPDLSLQQLASRLRPGDLVFIRVTPRPFLEVAKATGSWTNHVGIVVRAADGDAVIAESTFPRARRTPWPDFVARSEAGRVAVMRPAVDWTPTHLQALDLAVTRREGTFYDTGFDLHSSRQFCSRYVREVLQEATGLSVGEVQTFAQLLEQRPGVDLGFWRLWYLGRIPWQRQTVTPASVLTSDGLDRIFHGHVTLRTSALTAPDPSH